MARYSSRSTRKNSRHQLPVLGKEIVSNRIDASMDNVKAPTLDPDSNLVTR